MPNIRHPRFGSLQFWPRKRAKKSYARVRSFTKIEKANLVGFAGYKVGMTHISFIDNKKTSPSKGEEITCPVTIIECPPIKIYSVRFYKKTPYGLKLEKEIISNSINKELFKKLSVSKNKNTFDNVDLKDFDDITVIIYTQPKLTSIGKKKPDIFEIGIGGSKEEKFQYAKDNIDKEILLQNVFEEGQFIDTHAVTKGKGFQGTTKRFRTSILPRKTEKNRRGIGNVGAWSPTKVSFRIPQPGKHGFHERTQYNLRIMKISNNPSEIEQIGGFVSYGKIKNSYILLKGSVTGSKKRTIIIKHALRNNLNKISELPIINYISKESKQG